VGIDRIYAECLFTNKTQKSNEGLGKARMIVDMPHGTSQSHRPDHPTGGTRFPKTQVRPHCGGPAPEP
jgi:hypothetical protein